MNGEFLSINGHIFLMYGIFLLLFKVDEEFLKNIEYFRYLFKRKIMFSRKSKGKSEFIELIDKTIRLFYSKVMYAFYREHEHYFSKWDVLNSNTDTRCKVCGIRMSDYRVKERLKSKGAQALLNENNISRRFSASLYLFPKI